ncbi:radical SAM/SPASM domain-containing protein [Vallitalea sp.]|jgi:MoaA/NifB/PqqE/SkfB family radical SAM enzyme|uniref:radical SAM/SPASM domain-containing protein n=1 Tax=Vallitalea sp. TaxID=1882829 RepID=UPI0025DAC0FF|nr:radical SAM protein [Vallitalea sp.]MCT4686734.1 radical SAM protein [Vallitalea sp.]
MKRWFKVGGILVARNHKGIKLVIPKTKQICKLNEEQADIWLNRMEELEKLDKELSMSLSNNGFIVSEVENKKSIETKSGIIPQVKNVNIRWNIESKELYILLNSDHYITKNPIMILDNYGSLCWQGIIEGLSINLICEKLENTFGSSTLIFAYLKKFIIGGFIEDIENLCDWSIVSEHDAWEFDATELLSNVSHLATPWYCSWEICSACNLRCKHCYLPEYDHMGLETEKALEVAHQLIISKIYNVIIMGGEPLMRDDIELIVKKLRNNGVYVGIITNGQLLSKQRTKKLAEAGLGMIYVSFDGFTKEIHENIRGKDTFYNCMQAIRNAKDCKIPSVAVSWSVNSSNVNEYQKLPEFLKKLGVTECYLEVFKETGLAGSKAPFDPITIKEVTMIKHAISDWKIRYPDLNIVFNSQCLCGRSRMKLDAAGDAYICPFLTESFGNIFNTPLLELWHNIEESIPEKGPAGYCRTVRELYLMHMYG